MDSEYVFVPQWLNSSSCVYFSCILLNAIITGCALLDGKTLVLLLWPPYITRCHCVSFNLRIWIHLSHKRHLSFSPSLSPPFPHSLSLSNLLFSLSLSLSILTGLKWHPVSQSVISSSSYRRTFPLPLCMDWGSTQPPGDLTWIIQSWLSLHAMFLQTLFLM